MRTWFVVSWLFAFPIACGLGTFSIARRSTMSGTQVTYLLERPELLYLSILLMINVGLATACFVHREANRRRNAT